MLENQHLLHTLTLLVTGEILQYSLCPALGKMRAQIVKGVCPKHLQSPFGKQIKVSFIGPRPFIIYNPIGGSDFQVIKLLAKKLKFIPSFIPERRVEAVFPNGTKYGLINRV